MSDTDTRMAEWQYAYAENIDIRRDPDFIQLNSKPREVMITDAFMNTYTRSVTQPSKYFFYWENGQVYSLAWEQVTTLPNSNNIVNSTVFAWIHLFIYVFGNSIKFGGILDNNVPEAPINAWNAAPWFVPEYTTWPIIPYVNGQSAVTWAVPPVPPGAFDWEIYYNTSNGDVYIYDQPSNTYVLQENKVDPTWWLPCIPILNFNDNFLYVWVADQLFRVRRNRPGNAIVVDQPFEHSFPDNIRALTINGNLIKIYLANGNVYYWDQQSKDVSTFQRTDIPVRYVANFWAYDYIVGWWDASFSHLYIWQWLQFQLLKVWQNSKWSEDNSKYRYEISNPCGFGSMTQYGNIIFTWVRQWQLWSDPLAIWSWGNMQNGYPIAHVIESTVNSALDPLERIGFFADWYGAFPELLYSREANWQTGIDFIRLWLDPIPNIFLPAWVVYSPKYVLNHIDSKRIYELKVRYGDTAPGQTIQIEYSIDGGAYTGWFLIDENTDSVRKESKFRIILPLNELPEDDFFEIQFKISFSTDDENLTPKLYDILFEYEINEQ